MSHIENILDRLQKVRKNGQGWIACCPAHEDRVQSLSVSTGDDGRVLMHCHAGCSFDSVVNVLGLQTKDFFPTNSNGAVHGHSNKETPSTPPIFQEIVDKMHAELTEKQRGYLREKRMLSDVVIDRYRLGIREQNNEKRISIPILDANGNVVDVRLWLPPEKRNDDTAKILHWAKGYGGSRLFPIDQLEHNNLLLCEGELDSLAAISQGIPAITATCGVSTWNESLSAAFHGKDVTILMDNDTAGFQGAKKRAEMLIEAGATVKIASWSESRSVGWDITDELKKHDSDSLKRIIEQATPFTRNEASTESLDNEAKVKAWLEKDDSDVRNILPILRQVDSLTYHLYRKRIAKKSDIQASVLDEAVGIQGARKEKNQKSLEWEIPEPWPEAVDGIKLFQDVHETILRYVVTSKIFTTVCTLWTFFSHGLDYFDINPRLFITGPEKRCGKTTLLSILGALVPKCLSAANATPAAIFRAIDQWQPTLIIDEADSFAKQNDELRGVLNSGHTKSLAYVLRVVGDGADLEPKQFSTWAPMAIAGIGRVWDTLEDRSIVIELQRKTPNEKVQRLRGSQIASELKPLRQKLVRWMQDNVSTLKEPELPEALGDREADNWRPLLAIADLIGIGKEAREAAKTLTKVTETDESAKIKLLTDIRSLFQEEELWHSNDLVNKLVEIESSPWGDWKNGKPITVQKLAGLLKPFRIKPKQLYFNGINRNGYDKADFEDTFSRYLPILDSRCLGLRENNKQSSENMNSRHLESRIGGEGKKYEREYSDNGTEEQMREPGEEG